MSYQYPSNLEFVKREFKDIIMEKIDSDGSRLSVTEISKNGVVDFFHYDWYSDTKQLIAKFHSEPHEAKEAQTSTEPFHIHIPDKHGLSKEKRLPNEKHRDLISVLEFIRICIL